MVSTILLGLITILLAVNSCRLDSKQIDIEERKLEPRLQADLEYIYKSVRDSANREKIKIYNYGEDLTNLKIELNCLLELNLKQPSETIFFNYNNYFRANNINSVNGLISEFVSNYHVNDISSKESDFVSIYSIPNFIYLLKINYEDIIGNSFIEYLTYSTQSHSDGFKKIDKNEYNKTLNRGDINIIDYSLLNIEDIINHLKFSGYDVKRLGN